MMAYELDCNNFYSAMLSSDYSLEELTPASLKEIFESAQYECEYDDDEEPESIYLPELNRLYVVAVDDSDLLRFHAFKYSTSSLEEVRAFCRKVNESVHALGATSGDEKDKDGDYEIGFSYDLIVFKGERLAPKTIIKIARRMADAMSWAIEKHDYDGIFVSKSNLQS